MLNLLALLVVLLLSSLLHAQDQAAGPADPLAPFRAMLGNWQGQGTYMVDADAGTTKWRARAAFALCLGGKFVQEDLEFTFDGVPTPLRVRGYLGWDATRKRHVAVVASSAGEVAIHNLAALPEGRLLQTTQLEQQGVPYTDRTSFVVKGNTMSYENDLLMAQGPSIPSVRGAFSRQAKDAEAWSLQVDGEAFLGLPPHADIARLGKIAGTYETVGEVLLGVDQPKMQITATDRFTNWFSGGVLAASTVGKAVGMPGSYESLAFWAWDKRTECLRTVYVSSMGEVGQMESWWVGQQLVSVSAGGSAAGPITQRFVQDFDAQGAMVSAVGHSTMGVNAPSESFRATYKRAN